MPVTAEKCIISNKSSENLYRYNTFLCCDGHFVFRHGDRNILYGNFFLGEGVRGSGGVRVIGSKNYVINNYFHNTDARNGGVIVLQKGQSYNPGERRYNPQIDGCTIAYNTFVDNDGPALHLDQGARNLSPLSILIANNLVKDSDDNLVAAVTGTETWIGNIVDCPLGISNPGGITTTKIELELDGNDIWHLPADSPAIDAAKEGWGSVLDLSGLNVDVNVDYDFDGQKRTGQKDVGCDERTSGNITNHPMKTSDVGPVYLGGPPVDEK